MKNLLTTLFLFVLVFRTVGQTALAAQEIRHNSFVATPDPTIDSWLLMQVSRNAAFTDLIIDGTGFSSFYAQNPIHENSPLRITGLEANTTYYYRFAFDAPTPVYGNSISVTTWDPPESPVVAHPEISTYEVTLNWESDDPDVTGFEIWVYGIDGCPTSGGSYFQDNILTAGASARSITYDFVFFDEATYRFDVYALNADGEYGDPDIVNAFSCLCYESYDLSTLIDDYGLSLSWISATQTLIVNSSFDRIVDGETLPGSFFSSSSGGQSINQYLNWEWDITGGYQIDYSVESRQNRVKLNGSGGGTFSVKLVNPCTGDESGTLSYSIKEDQTITFNPLATKTFGDADFDLTASASSGLAVTYESSDESVATISGSTVTIMGAGTTTITASQDGSSTYNPAADVQQVLTVDKATDVITFDPPADISYSTSAFNLSATSLSGTTVDFESSDDAIVFFVGQDGFTDGTGTVNITASVPESANYYAATDVIRSLTVQKADQVISFDEITGTYDVNDGSFAINASSSSGLQVTYSSTNTAVAIASGTTAVVSIQGAGTTDIVASQAGNDLYNPAPDVSQTITINKLMQTVQITDLSSNSYTFGGSATPFQIVSNQGLGVMELESSDESIVSVNSVTNSGGGIFYGNISINGAGTATLTATQPGNATYEPASASTEITISKDDQLITFFSLDPVFVDEEDFEISATAESGLPVSFSSTNPAVATVDGTTVSIVGAGETSIVASQGGNVNYNAASDVPQTLTVMKLVQTISFSSIETKVYDDAPFQINASASSGLGLTYESDNTSVATVSADGTVTIVGVGSADITASQAGNAIYHPADRSQTLVVSKADQSITFGTLDDLAIGESTTLNATASSGLAIDYEVTGPATLDGNELTVTGVGTVTVTATQDGDANYNAASDVEQSFEGLESKLDQTITFSALSSRTYGDGTFSLSATASSGLSVSYVSSNTAVATVSGSTVTIVGAGNTTITASQDGNGDYLAAESVDQVLVIEKADQTVSFDLGAEASKTYGDDNFSVSPTASTGLEVIVTSSNHSVAVVDDNVIEIVGVGSATITATQAGNENYNSATTEQALTVGKADQVISFDPSSIGDQLLSGGGVSLDIVVDTSSPLTATIKSGPATIENTGPDFYEVTFSGEGTVVIEASVDETEFYNAAIEELSFNVIDDSKDEQTITFSEMDTRTYGDDPFELTASSSSGLTVSYTSSDESVATILGTEVTIVGAGSTVITASQSGDESFQAADDVSRTLTVEKADQTITFEELSNVGIDEEIVLVAEASSELSVSFSVSGPASLDGSTLTTTGVGEVSVTASQSGDENFNAAASVIRSFEVVEPQEQTITFDALENRTYGDDPFELKATSSSGLTVTLVSSDESIVSIDGNTATIISAGEVQITASQAGDAEFLAAENVAQTLTIDKADQVISFESPVDIQVGESFELAASSSSGLEITYEIDGPATLDGNTVSADAVGTVTITATQEGDNNFNAAEVVAHSFEVLEEALGLDEIEVKIYPNPASHFINFEGLDEPSVVFIFNARGQMLEQSLIEPGGNLSITHLTHGIYFLRVGNKKKMERIMIHR